MNQAINDKSKKQVLGRGLSALLGEVAREVPINNEKNPQQATMVEHRKYREVPTANIVPNPKQPRKNFDNDKLQELVASLKKRGVIQPLIVRSVFGKKETYELVAGERRWRAAQMAELHLVPVIVKDLDNAQTLELSLIENLHRDDLNAIEAAEAFQRLIDEFHYSHESLSQILGKSRSALTNDLRLLGLTDGVKSLIKIGKLSAAHGRNLVGVEDGEKLAMQVVSEGWSVRKLEREVKHWKGVDNKDKKITSVHQDADMKDIENRLMRLLGLKIKVKMKKGKSAGTIAIHFDNSTQLNKILQFFAKK
ncbi:MAG: ParB/RepB/Spo0J family partition protein [Alphaproteobacteria bacterium]